MKLYCFGHSGHSYKVANYLTLAGLPFEMEFVDFFNGASRTPDYQTLNPMGEAPVFQDGDVTLTQSGVILDYLVDQTQNFAPQDKYENLRWVLWDNHKFSSQIGMTRFYLNFLPQKHFKPEIAEFLLGRVKAALTVLEAALQNQNWLVGEAISPADFSCSSYLWYPEDFGFERAQYPNIDAWLSRIEAMPHWRHPYDLMPTDQIIIDKTPAAQNWHSENQG